MTIRSYSLEWMRKCYKGNGVELVTWVEKFAAIGRENQKQFIRYALHFIQRIFGSENDWK